MTAPAVFDSIFGGGFALPSGGLLSPEDADQLRSQSLLSAGLGVMSGGPGLGAALQQGLRQGQQSYQQAAQSALALRQLSGDIARQRGVQAARQKLAAIPMPSANDPNGIAQWIDAALPMLAQAGDDELVGRLSEIRKSLNNNQAQPPRKIEEVVDPKTGKPAWGYITPEGVSVIPGAAPFQRAGQEANPRLLTTVNPKTGKPEVAEYDPNTRSFRFTGLTPGSARDAAATEGERKGAVLLTMANSAAGVLDRADAPNRFESIVGNKGLNEILNSEAQVNQQAGLVIADAYIRLTSGANAPEPEVQRAMRMITPMPGDSKQLIARKRSTRQALMGALRLAAGRAGAGVPEINLEDPTDERPPLSSYRFGGQ